MIQSNLKMSEEFTFSVGMANISFAESESSLSGANAQEAASGSVANICGMLHYRFKTDDRKAWFGQFTFPLMAGEGSYMSAGGGLEYYFGQSTPAQMTLRDATTTLSVKPINRYFVSGGLNLGYISYLTETAKKNDTLLELELGGGVSHRFETWSLRVQAGLARGVGVATTTMGMKAMVGGIFFLE